MSSETKLGPLTVSRLGFGTLSLSPLQSFHEVDQGAELLCYAWHKGITFWDTAQIYANYPLLRTAIKKLPRLPVVATKTYAYSARGAEAAVDEARRQLDMDVLDIMLLHEQEAQTLPGHRPALDWLAGARERGLIRAVGVSTHSVACVLAAAELDEIDVIHPLYNKWGLGICDGSARDMAAAIARARRRGKGIYAMKVLGGGAMYRRAGKPSAMCCSSPGWTAWSSACPLPPKWILTWRCWRGALRLPGWPAGCAGAAGASTWPSGARGADYASRPAPRAPCNWPGTKLLCRRSAACSAATVAAPVRTCA